MGRLLLLWRLAARDLRRHPVEAVMVFLVIAAAATTLTVSFALNGVTSNPYQQTRSATAGPDVIADVIGAAPAAGSRGQPAGAPATQAAGTPAAIASLTGAPGVTAHSGPYPYLYSTIRFHGHRVDVVAEGRDQAPAPVDQPEVTQGSWVRPGGVVIARGFADALGVHVGDQARIGGQPLRVVGIAVTAAVPAYPSSLCHLACPMAVPPDMGLVWLMRSAAHQLAGQGSAISYLLNLKLASPADAPAFAAAHRGPPGAAPVLLYPWQSIRGADDALIQIEQVALQFGGWLLGLLALAGLAVLVGRRMTEQTRRVGLLKAVGATPATVAVVLLIEHLVLAAVAAATGLLAGWSLAPLLTSTGAGLVGSPGAPSLSPSTVLVVAAVALGVAAVSSLVPAVRAARTSTVSALADAPRVPPRRPLVIALSARLPVPLLLALRQLSRRPRRALLNALSIAVTVTGIVAILASYAHTSGTNLGISNLRADRLDELTAIITVMLAILAAVNTTFIAWATWMQHPVGYVMVNGKPQLNDIWALFTNPVFVWGYAKVIFAALVTGAAVMLAVSAWQLRHGGDRDVFTRSARLALVVLVPAILFTMLVGDELGVVEGRYQPMKIAAAEAQWTTCQPCSFSLFQIGGGNNDQTPTEIIAIPHLLSLLATNHWNGQVVGLNPLQQQYSKQYGPGYYVPNVFIQYWGMRVMAYGGVLVLAISVWGLWLIRRGKLATSRAFLWVAVWGAVLPFLMNTAGWLLTESGRQPWIVQGIMLTKNGISPTVGVTWLWISLIAFILLYGTLGTVDLLLMLRYSRKQLPPPRAETDTDAPVPAVRY